MLSHIHIKNFTIIETLDLELEPGFTVLTGETGAGKSIFVDAIGLALGDRADCSVVRENCDRAEITLAFDTTMLPEVKQWLTEYDLDTDDQHCHMRRIITKEGRSRAYINGQPVPAQTLKKLGTGLIDIHGQHEHQSLMKKGVQRQLLDHYAELCDLAKQVANAYRKWINEQTELDSLALAATERQARLELLDYQVCELNALDIKDNEIAELNTEHQRLAHQEHLLKSVQQSLNRLRDDEHTTIISTLEQQRKELEHLRSIDIALTTPCDLVSSTIIQLQEASNELRLYLSNLELEPDRLPWVEERLADLHQLSRKHRVPPEDLPTLLTTLDDELCRLKLEDKKCDTAQARLKEKKEAYFKIANTLSVKRQIAAKSLAHDIEIIIQQLGMPNGKFDIALEPLTPENVSAGGLERIEFLVSANPGHAPRPLSKVASGGELSRISLAIEVITANSGSISTFVFDEVDTGVGGSVAETIGQQLREIGHTHQVFCVTHLPQVAALGRHHLKVSKQSAQNKTTAHIEQLRNTNRHEEIARMLGGREITKQTRAHAKDMLARGQIAPNAPPNHTPLTTEAFSESYTE